MMVAQGTQQAAVAVKCQAGARGLDGGFARGVSLSSVSRGRRPNSTPTQAASPLVRVSVVGDDLGLSNQTLMLAHRFISWHRVPEGRVLCRLPGWAGPDRGPSAAHHHHPTNNRACLETPQGGPFPDARYLSETSPPWWGFFAMSLPCCCTHAAALDQGPSKPPTAMVRWCVGGLRRGLNGGSRWAREQVRERAPENWRRRAGLAMCQTDPARKPARLSTWRRRAFPRCPLAQFSSSEHERWS
jgi:hypothetical protein